MRVVRFIANTIITYAVAKDVESLRDQRNHETPAYGTTLNLTDADRIVY